jgi:hypothetical protein
VSDTGGPYTAWQTAVATTSADFTGQAGHTYAFYSIATDGSGNVQSAKTSPDTTTTVTGSSCGVTNVTAQITTTVSGFRYNSATQLYLQSVTATNNGSALTGPVYLALDSISPGATLSGALGATSCSVPTGAPYVSLNNGLAPGQTVTLRLQFATTSGPPILYTPQYLNGAGQP